MTDIRVGDVVTLRCDDHFSTWVDREADTTCGIYVKGQILEIGHIYVKLLIVEHGTEGNDLCNRERDVYYHVLQSSIREVELHRKSHMEVTS
jgi:hypothetical protein